MSSRITRTAKCIHSGAGELQEETVQIGMPSLWGVFWIIYGGFVLSAVVLIIEWIVSAVGHVDPTGVKVKPMSHATIYLVMIT